MNPRLLRILLALAPLCSLVCSSIAFAAQPKIFLSETTSSYYDPNEWHYHRLESLSKRDMHLLELKKDSLTRGYWASQVDTFDHLFSSAAQIFKDSKTPASKLSDEALLNMVCEDVKISFNGKVDISLSHEKLSKSHCDLVLNRGATVLHQFYFVSRFGTKDSTATESSRQLGEKAFVVHVLTFEVPKDHWGASKPEVSRLLEQVKGTL